MEVPTASSGRSRVWSHIFIIARRGPLSPIASEKGKNVTTRGFGSSGLSADGFDRSALLADPFVSGRTVTRTNQAAASKYDLKVDLRS